MRRLSEAAALPQVRRRPAARRRAKPRPVRPAATQREDPRWAALCAVLAALRADRRCALRLVEVRCGAGGLLLRAARQARALGFTAIEVRGIDASAEPVRRARRHAEALRDPAIGLCFEVADAETALAQEAELPADILLWPGALPADAATRRALHAAAAVVIAEDAAA